MDIYYCLKYKTTLIRKLKTVEVAPIIVDWNSVNEKYCVTISMQKISSIHLFIREILQVLESHHLKYHVHL